MEAECISDISYIGTVAGIGIGILIPILIVIILIALYVFMSQDKQEGEYITYEHGE